MLGHTGPLALGDEPLPGRVEHQPGTVDLQPSPQVREPLGDDVHRQVREQRPLRRQLAQKVLQHRVQRDQPFRRVGLELPQRVGTHPNEPTQIAFPDQVLPQQPDRLARAHAGQQADLERVMDHLIPGVQKRPNLVVGRDGVGRGFDLPLEADGPERVLTQMPLVDRPVQEVVLQAVVFRKPHVNWEGRFDFA